MRKLLWIFPYRHRERKKGNTMSIYWSLVKNNFKKKSIFSIIIEIIILFSIALGHLDGLTISHSMEVTYESLTDDLIIDGDGDFWGHSFISGDGSKSSPFLINGLDMGSYSIHIRNTTSYFIISNILWGTSTGYKMNFQNNDHIKIENISIDADHFFKGDTCPDLQIFNCSFTSTSTDLNSVFNDLTSLKIIDTTFSVSTSSNYNVLSTIQFNGEEGNTYITNSTFEGYIILSSIEGDHIVDHSDFTGSSYVPMSMSDKSEIRYNNFRDVGGKGYNGLYIYRVPDECNKGVIHNNTFTNIQNGMYINGKKGFQPDGLFIIKNNLFQGCYRGIYIIPSELGDIFDNQFTGCENSAIFFLGGNSYNIWRNIFKNNRPGGTNPQVVYSIEVGQSNNWDVYGIGNYWSDHLSPDIDKNGIVDTPYDLGDGSDKYPVTNIDFDTKIPFVSFTNISSGHINRSYNRISWESGDEWGLEKVEMVHPNGHKVPVPDTGLISVLLNEGVCNYSLIATDTHGLVSTVNLSLILNETIPVINFTKLYDGQYLDTDPVKIEWSIVDYFPVDEINLTLDGKQWTTDPYVRMIELDVNEGAHSFQIRIEDDRGLFVYKTVNFILDRSAPRIYLNGPSPGSTISCENVFFQYEIHENIRFDRIRYHFDDEDWTTSPNETMIKKFLNEGDHIFVIEASDMAGHISSNEVSFIISNENIINISSPMNGTVFSSDIINLEWEYLGNFEWNSAYMRIGITNDFVPISENNVQEITITKDGKYLITLKLEDELGNNIKSEIWVIRDTKRPSVGFLGLEEGQFFSQRNVTIFWNAIDDLGISNYFLCLDDGEWQYMGLETSTELILNEGEHTLKIKVCDLAQNWFESQIRIIVDLTEPILEFKDMDTYIFTSQEIEFEWYCEDNYDLKDLFLTIEGGTSKNVLGRYSAPLFFMKDGGYKVILDGTDLAGNKARIERTLIIDLTSPVVSWVGEIITITNIPHMTLEWAIEEENGIKGTSVIIDDEEIEIDGEVNEYSLQLSEGIHQISLKVEDIAGWESILDYPNEVIIDFTKPILEIDPDSSVSNGVATIRWTSSDEMTILTTITISIDGELPFEVKGNSYQTENLGPGEHTITINARDSAGNEANETWIFNVETEENGDHGTGIPIFVIIIVIVIVLILICGSLIGFIKISQTKKEEEELNNNIEQENSSNMLPPQKVSIIPRNELKESTISKPDQEYLPPGKNQI